MQQRAVRALYDANTITVYQAYNAVIAKSALDHQTFVEPPFKKNRMTWIKPSFLWMMYRSSWATKENQDHILAIKLKRKGFERLLRNACLSQFNNIIHPSKEDWKEKLKSFPVRVQWDPEKDLLLQPLSYRSIQIGLAGIAMEKYTSEFIVQINDITEHCIQIASLIKNEQMDQAKSQLLVERDYVIPSDIKLKIMADG